MCRWAYLDPPASAVPQPPARKENDDGYQQQGPKQRAYTDPARDGGDYQDDQEQLYEAHGPLLCVDFYVGPAFVYYPPGTPSEPCDSNIPSLRTHSGRTLAVDPERRAQSAKREFTLNHRPSLGFGGPDRLMDVRRSGIDDWVARKRHSLAVGTAFPFDPEPTGSDGMRNAPNFRCASAHRGCERRPDASRGVPIALRGPRPRSCG